MNITAVVVVFNPNVSDLFDNVLSYRKYVDQIILIDNSTELHSKELIRNGCLDRQYLYCDMNGNIGVAAALNTGFEFAITHGAEWVLTMDQDSSFISNLDGFKSYILNKDVNNSLLLAPVYSNFDSNPLCEYEIHNPKFVIQSGNLVNTTNYLKIGKFRENFFIDFVDYEYCLRGHSHKLAVTQISSVILKHSPGETTIGHFLGFKYTYWSSAPNRYYYVIRNGLSTAFEYHNLWCLSIVLKTIIRVILLEKNKKRKLFFIQKGGIDYLKSIYGKLQE